MGTLAFALIDALIAVTAYGAAWVLRFGDALATFAPFARRAFPVIVFAQLAGLAAAGAWRRPVESAVFVRTVIGVVAGSFAGAVIVYAVHGGAGLSREALALDAGILVALAFTWRAAVVLWTMLQTPAGEPAIAPPPGLEVRTRRATLRLEFASLYKYRSLLRSVVTRDLKLKYRGSVIGVLWSMLQPLLMMVVYMIAFTYILRIRSAGFVFYLLLGLMAWTFFANSAGMSTGAIVDSGSLVKSVYFPRTVLPIGTVLFNFAQFILTMAVMLPLMLVYYRVPLGPQMLLYPVFLLMQLIFTVGVALALSAATAFYRDVRHLLDVALSVLFWLTPIVYETVNLPDRLRLPILLTPVSPFISAYHEMFYYRRWPDATVWLIAIVYTVTALVAGATIFLTSEEGFAEQI